MIDNKKIKKGVIGLIQVEYQPPIRDLHSMFAVIYIIGPKI